MRQLETAIRGLSRRSEFFIVLLAAFGWFAIGSLGSVGTPVREPMISEYHLNTLLVYESIVLVAVSWFLLVRGWTPARVGLTPSWQATAEGVGLAALAYGAYIILWVALSAFTSVDRELTGDAPLVASGIGLGTILAISILNPLFEELFVCGYLIAVLRETRGFWFAVNVSAGVRLLYHLYQGPLAIVSILPIGLIFGYWFARTGRLWPLIVAHALFDAVALLAWQ